MKKVIWENKSNKQLCVTIPKNSGFQDGEIVNIEKTTINTIVISSVTGDLFHYGHLRILETANQLGDFHICGILSNDAIKAYKNKPIADLKERKSIISSLRCVDMVLTQKSLNPIEIINEIIEMFPQVQNIKIVYGNNWESIPGEKEIEKLGVEIIKLDFYEKLSDEKIIKKINKNGK